ncbi:MAG TPA: ribbon-helix-helix domain-containing protein [Desulfobacterales bacterium]|jgi:predicted transcriptional regulator|nr:ribbon-helix-helix domain-containing protein [Desulfobacterales bacterium]HSM88438.1 ribbon-helix-helix domain-containing protein [Desulfobacterales bacterium]
MGQKKTFSTRIDDDLLKELKHLSVDTDKSLGELLEEAIAELIRKYSKPKKSSRRVRDASQENESLRGF